MDSGPKPPVWYSPDYDMMDDAEKETTLNRWTSFSEKIRRRHWFLSSRREMHELFVKKKIVQRKCFRCPTMLSHTDVVAAYTIPYQSIPVELKGNFATFCLCQKCIYDVADDPDSDISRMTLISVLAQQNDTAGELHERKSEMKCLSDELTRLSRDIAAAKNRVIALKTIQSEKNKERDDLLRQIDAVKQEVPMLQAKLEEEKKKTGTAEYKEALAKLQAPLQSALDNFKSFRKMIDEVSSGLETLSEEADDVGHVLKISHVCKICMGPKEKWISFDCGHIFCQECVAMKHDTCAFCNKQIQSWHEVYLP